LALQVGEDQKRRKQQGCDKFRLSHQGDGINVSLAIFLYFSHKIFETEILGL